MLSAYQVFGVVAREEVLVLILTRGNLILLWNFPFYFILLLQVLVIWSLCFACNCSQGYGECMRRQGQVELHPFDPELERTLHRSRRELRKAQHRNLAIMQNNVEQDHGQEQNEPQGGHSGNNGRNHPAR